MFLLFRTRFASKIRPLFKFSTLLLEKVRFYATPATHGRKKIASKLKLRQSIGNGPTPGNNDPVFLPFVLLFEQNTNLLQNYELWWICQNPPKKVIIIWRFWNTVLPRKIWALFKFLTLSLEKMRFYANQATHGAAKENCFEIQINTLKSFCFHCKVNNKIRARSVYKVCRFWFLGKYALSGFWILAYLGKFRSVFEPAEDESSVRPHRWNLSFIISMCTSQFWHGRLQVKNYFSKNKKIPQVEKLRNCIFLWNVLYFDRNCKIYIYVEYFHT